MNSQNRKSSLESGLERSCGYLRVPLLLKSISIIFMCVTYIKPINLPKFIFIIYSLQIMILSLWIPLKSEWNPIIFFLMNLGTKGSWNIATYPILVPFISYNSGILVAKFYWLYAFKTAFICIYSFLSLSSSQIKYKLSQWLSILDNTIVLVVWSFIISPSCLPMVPPVTPLFF